MDGIWQVQTSKFNSTHESSGSRESSVFVCEMNYESLICCCLVEIEN